MAERGLHLVSPLAGDCPARGDRAAGAARGPASRAWPGRRAGARQRGRAGRSAAALARARGDVEATGRERAHGRRIPRDRRHPRARSRGRPTGSTSTSTPSSERSLRSVLLRLVAPSPDGDPVRSRVASRTLLGDPGRERVVSLLVRARLVTAEQDAFELAHEALARAWPRLQAGSTRTPPASASCATWRRPLTGGTRSAGRRASSTAAPGSRRRWSGARPRIRT